MRKLFYKWISGSRYMKFHYEIKKALKIIEAYQLYDSDKFHWENINIDDLNGVYTISNNDKDITICKTVDGQKISYNIFIGNMQIRVENNNATGESVYSIHIKDNSTQGWCVFRKNECVDYSHPDRETYRVFIWYDVPVLDITRSVGEVYQNGSWNKYVCQTLDYFATEIEKVTDLSKFNSMYEESDWESFKNWVKSIFKK